MATTKTNAQVDTLAAAIAAPYGPLTRVTDIEAATVPTPNSGLRIEFTSAIDDTPVWASFDELSSLANRAIILEAAHGFEAIINDMKTAIDELDTIATAMTSPHTYADYETLIDAMRSKLTRWLRAIDG